MTKKQSGEGDTMLWFHVPDSEPTPKRRKCPSVKALEEGSYVVFSNDNLSQL